MHGEKVPGVGDDARSAGEDAGVPRAGVAGGWDESYCLGDRMTLLVANVGLFSVLGAAAFLVSRRVQDRTRVQLGVLLAVVTLPAALYSLYYFHWFDGWSWFYRFRSYPLRSLIGSGRCSDSRREWAAP